MRLDRIVVAVDFMEPGLEAARWTAVHLSPDSALRLVHVIHVPTPPFFMRGLYPSPDELAERGLSGPDSRPDRWGRARRADPRGGA